MKGSLVNQIDVDDSDETSFSNGAINQADVSSTEDLVHQQLSLAQRSNPRANESRSQRNDQTDQSSGTTTNVVNFADLDDIEAAPPRLSRQEAIPVSAPPVTLNSPHRRMIVDVDEYMDTENKDDFADSADDSIPSALSTPERSASQNAAIKAVLGHDDFDKGTDEPKKISDKLTIASSDSVTGYTADLSEDEIAVIIPPELQRQSGSHNSTPGAFSVPGRADVSGLPPVSTRARSASRRSHTGIDEYGGDGIHMISATLVGNDAGETDMNQDAPMLVYAERLWWKRRFVLCLSVWILLAIAAISVSITLALRISLPTRTDQSTNEKESLNFGEGENDNSEVESAPNMSTSSISPSKSPIDVTAFPSDLPSPSPTLLPDPPTNPTATKIAMHSASWGVLTSCSAFNNEVQSYEMTITCAGTIALEKYDNADCSEVIGSNRKKLSCRLNSSMPYTDPSTNNVYQQATGAAMFSCSGELDQDLPATLQLSNVTVPNCLPSTSSLGTAITFVSAGRFCQDGSNIQLRDVLVNNCVNSKTCNVFTPSLQVCDDATKFDIFDINFGDLVNRPREVGDDFIAFCYGSSSSSSCSNQNATSDGCTLNVPELTSEYNDFSSDTCTNPDIDEATIDTMWNITQTHLDPLQRRDVIISSDL